VKNAYDKFFASSYFENQSKNVHFHTTIPDYKHCGRLKHTKSCGRENSTRFFHLCGKFLNKTKKSLKRT